MANRTYLKQQRGWWITRDKSGRDRYYREGVRKSAASFQRSSERAQKKFEKAGGWRSETEFKKQMRTSQAQRWIELGGVETDGAGFPDIDSGFSHGYREAMEDDFDPQAHRPFSEFLEDDLDLREEDADYDVGDTPTK